CISPSLFPATRPIFTRLRKRWAVCCFPLLLPPCLQNSQPTAANYPYTTNNSFYSVITNNEVLSIFAQQKAADWPPKIWYSGDAWREGVSRPLDNGAFAVGFLSYTNPTVPVTGSITNFTLNLPAIGCNPALTYAVRDCWNHVTLTTCPGNTSVTLSNLPLACGMLFNLFPTNPLGYIATNAGSQVTSNS